MNAQSKGHMFSCVENKFLEQNSKKGRFGLSSKMEDGEHVVCGPDGVEVVITFLPNN